MNTEMTNRVVELIRIAIKDLKEVDDPYAEDATGCLFDALAILDGDFGSYDEFTLDEVYV